MDRLPTVVLHSDSEAPFAHRWTSFCARRVRLAGERGNSHRPSRYSIDKGGVYELQSGGGRVRASRRLTARPHVVDTVNVDARPDKCLVAVPVHPIFLGPVPAPHVAQVPIASAAHLDPHNPFPALVMRLAVTSRRWRGLGRGSEGGYGDEDDQQDYGSQEIAHLPRYLSSPP